MSRQRKFNSIQKIICIALPDRISITGGPKYGWAAYSRPGMQWMKKIFKWPLMFGSMVTDMVIDEEDRIDESGCSRLSQ